uniref:Uncharacterized protein n=1 Tax=Arundo donax TaxID=35708 RepID=A0A0A8ZQW8_ARUDO
MVTSIEISSGQSFLGDFFN